MVSIDEQLKKIEIKKNNIKRITELYKYFSNKIFVCPFCKKNSNIQSIIRHTNGDKCKKIQNVLRILKSNEIIDKCLSAITYNQLILKQNYHNRNNDDYNEEELLIVDIK